MQAIRVLLFVVSLYLPGFCCSLLLTKSLQKSLVLAVPISSALAYSLGNYSDLVGIPFGSAWLMVESLVLFGAVVLVQRRQLEFRINFNKFSVVVGVLIVACSAKFLYDWHAAAGSFTQLLPNHDAMYHSYAIRNILNSHSNTVAHALQLFPEGAGTAASFYPLGLHSILALGISLSGISINLAMNIATVGIGLCLFPVSMVLWTRCLQPNQRSLMITCVPAVFMLATVFPLSPFSWGGMPAIVAMTLAPAIASVMVDLLHAHSMSARIAMSLALVGIFSIHATELITVGVLVLVACAARGELKIVGHWMRKKEPFWIAGISGTLLAPIVAAARGGASERTLDYQPVLDLTETIGHYVLFSFSGFAMPIAAALCVIGIIAASRYRMTIASWSILVLGVICGAAVRFPNNPLVNKFTKPWYGQVLRLDYNIVYFAAPLIAVGLLYIFDLISSNKSIRMKSARISLVGILAIGVLVPSFKQSEVAAQKLEESWYNGLIPVNQNSITAFKWMKDHIGPDEYVMTDVDGVDGSTWMYALANVRPIMYGAITSDSRDQWRSVKNGILQSIGKLSDSADKIKWLETHKIRYFYFDERTNAIAPKHSITLDALNSEKRLREVLHIQNAHVFEFIRVPMS
jgi:hypothetical protein